MRIELKRITLVTLIEAIAWRESCPEALRHTRKLTRKDQVAFYKELLYDPTKVYFSICNEDKIVGMASLSNIDIENKTAEIGILIAPESRGEGVGTKVVELILKEAKKRGLKNVYGECFYCNFAGIKFWNKMYLAHGGYRTDLPDRKYFEGRSYSSLYFSISLLYVRECLYDKKNRRNYKNKKIFRI